MIDAVKEQKAFQS